MQITNSQAKAFLRCQNQYSYKFDRLLVPKMLALPLKRGSWLHELLEAHYRGEDWRQANEELAIEFNRMFEEERERFGDLPTICADIMQAYVYHWREEDAGFKILAVEETFEVDLPHGHTLKFRVDGIVEDDYGRWLLEHKSHKTYPNDNYRFIDVQSSRYVWALNKLGWEIEGVIWNYLRTKQPTKPKMTKMGRLSKAKLDTELFTYVRGLKELGLDPRDYSDVISRLKKHNTFFRRERVPKPKKVIETFVREIVHTADTIERGYHPDRSVERSCSHSCDYLELCMTELYGGDARQVQNLRYRGATEQDYYGLQLDEGLKEDQ